MRFLDKFLEDYQNWRTKPLTSPLVPEKIHFVHQWAKTNDCSETLLWDNVLLCDYEWLIKENPMISKEEFVNSWSYYFGLFINKTKEQQVLCIKNARITNPNEPSPQQNQGENMETVQVVLNGVRVFLEMRKESPESHIHTLFVEVFDADPGANGKALLIRPMNSHVDTFQSKKKFAIDFVPKSMGEAQAHVDNVVKEEDAKEPMLQNPEDLKLWLTWYKDKKQRLFYAFQKFHIPEEHQERYYKQQPWKEVIAKHMEDF